MKLNAVDIVAADDGGEGTTVVNPGDDGCLIGRTAIPLEYQTAVLLHARAYNPKEALEHHLLDGLVKEGDDLRQYARSAALTLLDLDPLAYAFTKKRMRSADIQKALELLDDELPAKIHESQAF